jgi:hypothetical protein
VTIALEGGARAMKSVGVELDNEFVIAPRRVDLEAFDESVCGWRVEAVPAAKIEEERFEVGAAGFGLDLLADEGSERFRPTCVLVGFEQALNGSDVREPQTFGVLPSAGKSALVDHPGEVEQGAGHRSDRDAVADRFVVGLQLPR